MHNGSRAWQHVSACAGHIGRKHSSEAACGVVVREADVISVSTELCCQERIRCCDHSFPPTPPTRLYLLPWCEQSFETFRDPWTFCHAFPSLFGALLESLELSVLAHRAPSLPPAVVDSIHDDDPCLVEAFHGPPWRGDVFEASHLVGN